RRPEPICAPNLQAHTSIKHQPAISADLAAGAAAQSAEGPSLISAIREKTEDTTDPIDAEVDALINAARNSPDPGRAFARLLRAANWTRRAWADAAACSEPTVSRWIRRIPVPRSEKPLWNALHQRLQADWPSLSAITFQNH